MERFLLCIRKWDRTFTLRYKELGWNILLLGKRNLDGTSTVMRNWDEIFMVRYKQI